MKEVCNHIFEDDPNKGVYKRKDRDVMNRQMLKKVAAVLGLVLSLSFFTGIISTTTVQAQNRDNRWHRDNDRRDDRRDWNRRNDDRNRDWERNREWERRREIARQRAIQEMRRRQWERDRYRNSRNYPYYGGTYGGYGNSGGYYGGYNNSELQRGYHNGLKEGLDDAKDRDSFNPNRHSSFRDGNQSYRQGFYRGYQEGYRQNSYYRGW